MRTVTILCDGGLGNRLSGLIGGMITAQELNADFTVSWPANNWCGCNFEDLFDTKNVKHNSQNINDIFTADNVDAFLIHSNQTTVQLSQTYSHTLENLAHLRTVTNNVVYYHNKLMPYHTADQILTELSRLNINQRLLQRVMLFCQNNCINNTTVGLHLRKTENSQLDEEKFFKEVSTSSSKQYFVCSDDYDTENKFCSLSNVCANPKTEYVTKMSNGGWFENLVDSNGRPTKYNIQRSRQSVVEAFEDMLILSRCWIKPTVKSSFSAFAGHYSKLSFDILTQF
jgi:hypothetical protein